MNKNLSIILLIALFSGILKAHGEEIVNPSDIIFRSSLTEMVQDLGEDSEMYSDERNFTEISPANMPFFKQMRLRLSNKYLDVTTREERAEANNYTYTPKWKLWDKNRGKFQPKTVVSDVTESGELADNISAETNSGLGDLSFETSVNADVTENQLLLDSEYVSFDEETGDMIATGRPVLNLPPQNTVVEADKMTYNDDGNILKGIGNVVLTKDGKPVFSRYFEIDMNEEAMLLDDMVAKTDAMNLKAEKAMQKEGLIILENGSLYSEKSSISRIASRMIGPKFSEMIVSPEAQALFFANPDGNNLSIHIDNIEVDARKNHDVIKVKNAKFYHKDKYLFRLPSITAYTNKQHDYFEGNYPEFGSRRKLGMFVGPGFTFGGPLGSVIKVVPFLNYKSDDFGAGGLLKYVNTYNRTELGYGSANDLFFLRGTQRLDDHLHLHYAANSYTDEWFLGARMAKYMAEVYYDRAYENKDFLAKNMDLTFRHRASFGLMEDDDRSYYGEKFSDATGMSTTRTRYMAELNQSFFKYKNEDERLAFDLGVALQGSAALYGTGDTQFIARFGPRLKTQYKNWMQNIGYYVSGYDDRTPMPRYDAYRYGKQSVHITEALRLNRYISVGWSGNINLSDDAPNGKMFQENAFLVSLGPDDCKIVLGYDFVRQRTYFGFNLAFDPKGTNITFDKMIITNPELLGKQQDDEELQIAFAPSKTSEVEERKLFNKNTKSQFLQYAQVIDLENSDRERID